VRPFRAPHHTISVAGLIGGARRCGGRDLAGPQGRSLSRRAAGVRARRAGGPPAAAGGRRSLARRARRIAPPCRAVHAARRDEPLPVRACGRSGSGSLHVHSRRQGGATGGASPDPSSTDSTCTSKWGPPAADLLGQPQGEGSGPVRERVERARALQRRRYAHIPGLHCNAQLSGPAARRLANATDEARSELAALIEIRGLSVRAHDRMLKLARTIADLQGDERVGKAHVHEPRSSAASIGAWTAGSRRGSRSFSSHAGRGASDSGRAARWTSREGT